MQGGWISSQKHSKMKYAVTQEVSNESSHCRDGVCGLPPWFRNSRPGSRCARRAQHDGCLAKGDDAGTFKLTDLEKGPKEVVIAETTANLAPHLGHKVEITGVAVTGKDKTHTMKVTAVKMISSKC